MYRNILVPLDGSPFSEQALPLAISLARRADGALRLVYVHAPLGSVYAEAAVTFDISLERELKHREKVYLDDLADRIRALGNVPVQTVIAEGSVTPTIRAAVAGTEADLIVMTTHGRGPMGRFWLGSVADELVRESPVPLLLVRPKEEALDLDKEVAIRRVLLPLDGSALAEAMIEPAIALGGTTDAEYTLLRVIRPVLPPPRGAEGATLNARIHAMMTRIEEMQYAIRRDAQAYLDAVAQRLRERSLRIETRIAIEAQPAVAILQEAIPPVIDAIALETHGRHGLPRLFLGSVADKVIRGASVPVLVQRPM